MCLTGLAPRCHRPVVFQAKAQKGHNFYFYARNFRNYRSPKLFFAQLFHYAAQCHSQERLNIKYLSTVTDAVITFTKLNLFWTSLYTIPTSEVSGNTTIIKTGINLRKGVSTACTTFASNLLLFALYLLGLEMIDQGGRSIT